MKTPIEKSLRDAIRREYINGPFNKTWLAKDLGVSLRTVKLYVKKFRRIEIEHPRRLKDFNFYIMRPPQPYAPSERHREMIRLLPQVIDMQVTNKLSLIPMWEDYRKLCPAGFSLHCFTQYFIAWRRKNGLCLYHHRRVKSLTDEEFTLLKSWRHSYDRRKWERAILILESYSGKSILQIAAKMDRPVETVLRWINRFRELGVTGLSDKPYTFSEERSAPVRQKHDNISKLIHESPKLHGFNRTSWRMQDLSEAYEKTYGVRVATSTLTQDLRKMGYAYSKSREVLTSPDPKFREKVTRIQEILSGLNPDERFFSVDEFGHMAVKMKVGRSYVKKGDLRSVPQLQKSKGFICMTAALELTSNQVTHFFCKEKNTEEMIRLIDLLRMEYAAASTLYITWDAAQWHNSKKLKEYIQELNTGNIKPLITLAPLPSSAQFLNVIESVFSGMARAIIHNSDYTDVEECKTAINRYFSDRNVHFREHPHKAGKYLWGEEKVKPIFSESNNSKAKQTPKYL